jgi:hypothetical protein
VGVRSGVTSEDIVPGEVFHEYWQLRVNAAESHLSAARKIISHSTTRGTIAEHAVRSIIAPLLPHRFGISNGFLLTKGADASPQIDLLVFDRLEASPVYEDAAFAVVSPGMGVLAVEVKSTLNKKDLREAVKNLASAKRLSPNIATVLFAFTGMSAKTLAKHLPGLATPLPRTERVDVIINLKDNYVADLDDATRATYNCYRTEGIAVKTLLLQAIASAKVNNLMDYIDVGPKLDNPFQQINV